MAKPIQETPVLKGKDAKRFIEIMNAPKTPIDPATRERMKSNFKKLTAIAEF